MNLLRRAIMQSGGAPALPKYEFTGNVFDIEPAIGDVSASGITWTGTHFWIVVSDNPSFMFKLNPDFTYAGITINGLDQSVFDLTFDGTHVWTISNISDNFVNYDKDSGNQISAGFSTAPQNLNPLAAVWDSIDNKLLTNPGGDVVDTWTNAGVYSGTRVIDTTNSNYLGFNFDGENFLLQNPSLALLQEVNYAGVQQGIGIDISALIQVESSTNTDKFYYLLVASERNVYEYSKG